MANTTPTVFSDAAYNTVLSAKMEPQGVLAQKAVVNLATTVTAGTLVAMIPFEAGFSLLEFSLAYDALGTGVTLDVGYAYPTLYTPPGVVTNEALAAFVSAQSGATAGSIVWPTAGGLLNGISFTAAQPGYITVRTAGATVGTAGNVTILARFTYDMKAT